MMICLLYWWCKCVFSLSFNRIQPLHLFIMCLTIGLISLVQWGPYWFPFVDTMMDCKSYWWANLLLISNLLPVHEIVSLDSDSDVLYVSSKSIWQCISQPPQCIPWTWYLSLDFQCYATTPLLVYFYRLYVLSHDSIQINVQCVGFKGVSTQLPE